MKCFSCAGVDVDGICYWTSYYSIEVYLPGCELYGPRITPLKLRFSHSLAEVWFKFILEKWTPRTNIIVFLPCATRKPYWRSITHRCFFKRIWNLWFEGKIDLVVLSEPLTVVPADYDYPYRRYPLYEYPPSDIKKNVNEQRIWCNRLSKFLKKHHVIRKFAILYEYHRSILGKVLAKYNVLTLYTSRPYIVKTVRKLLELMSFS